MVARRRLATALAALAALAALGCGDQGAEREAFPAVDAQEGALADSVPLDDAAQVAEAQDRIEQVCLGLLTGVEAERQLDLAVRELVQIYREYPQAFYESGDIDRRKLMPAVLRDDALILRRCGQPTAAARLEQAVRPEDRDA
ncbi:MAG: hypothetical protein M3P39_10605 [Actinomycetota bacterium]|nr:hypothetical protein [Actinomycetota bacterium]